MKSDVLVIHPRAELRDVLCEIVVAGGYACRTAVDAVSARQEIRQRRPGLVLLDGRLDDSPEVTLELLDRLVAGHYPVPVIVIGVPFDAELGRKAMAHGACDVVERPWNSVDLLRILKHATEDTRLRREAAEAKAHTHLESDLVGNSDAVIRLREAIVRAANSDLPLLITGATGTGKELSGRLIHQKSHRSKDRFVVFDCATLESDRAEEELFGIDTADEQDNWAGTMLGAIDRADRGTLFISNVEALPKNCQRKLLLYLLNGRFERAAGNLEVEVDTRVIAATGHDLAESTKSGMFREDLYHRLRSNCIQVPSLSSRAEDIPLLVRHFLKRLSGSAGSAVPSVDARALVALQAASWPGNIHELRNTLERLFQASRTGRRPVRASDVFTEIGKTKTVTTPSTDVRQADRVVSQDSAVPIDETPLFGQVVGRVKASNYLAELLHRIRSVLREMPRVLE